jgi:hypothetical protein
MGYFNHVYPIGVIEYRAVWYGELVARDESPEWLGILNDHLVFASD